jgi:glycosyltransferase involved in cell wall biosynthesis
MGKGVGIVDFIGVKGGHHYYSLCLLDAFESKGIKTFYFSNLDDSEFSKTQCVKVFSKDIKKNFVGLKQLFFATLKSIRISKKNGVKTQIYHVFEASLINCLVLLMLKMAGFKTIVIVHDVNSFDIEEKSILKNIQYNRLSDELVVHNQYCYDLMKEGMPSLKTEVHIIAHGGHFQVIKPLAKMEARKRLQLDLNKTYFLFFGQIRKSKGLDVLLEAFPKLDNAKLIIAGKPWRDDFSEYQSIIDRRGISSHVKSIIRYIEEDEKDLFYSASDFVILPYKEIYQSGVLLMSMSYGRAVIASDLKPNKEVIIDGENGLLFKEGDFESLAEVITKASQAGKADVLGEQAKQTIRKDFDWFKIADTYLPLMKG